MKFYLKAIFFYSYFFYQITSYCLENYLMFLLNLQHVQNPQQRYFANQTENTQKWTPLRWHRNGNPGLPTAATGWRCARRRCGPPRAARPGRPSWSSRRAFHPRTPRRSRRACRTRCPATCRRGSRRRAGLTSPCTWG